MLTDSKVSPRSALTREQVYWAYDQYCVGYTIEQIGEALFVSGATVRRTFQRLGLERVRQVLKAPPELFSQEASNGTEKA